MNKKKRELLKATKRELFGKKVDRLRKEGILPASVYGKGFESISIQADAKRVTGLFEELGESGLFDVEIEEGKSLPVLFKNPQIHPVTGKLVHVDLYKVDLSQKITAEVPVVIIGEAPIIKLGNVLVHITNEVEVEALPTDLPEKIEVDVSKLESLEDMITVADLDIDKELVTMLTAPEQIVVKAEEPKEEEVEMVEAPPEVEGAEEGAETSEETTEATEEKKKESEA